MPALRIFSKKSPSHPFAAAPITHQDQGICFEFDQPKAPPHAA
jgi:hypothetical protein